MREREGERDNFKELAHTIVVAWQEQNLQGRLAGWRPREDLQFKFRSSRRAEFLLTKQEVLFCYSLSIHKNSLLESHVYKNQSSLHRLFTTLFAVKSFLAETGHNLWL